MGTRLPSGGYMLAQPITTTEGNTAYALQVQTVDASGNPSGGTGAASSQVQGNSASNAADTGNPVKVGGVVASGFPAGASANQRKDFWVTPNGALMFGGYNAGLGSDAMVTTLSVPQADSGTSTGMLSMAGYVFNGTSWSRTRGDTSGLFVGAAQFFTESTTAQAASGVVNGTTRGNGGTAGGIGTRFSFFVAEAFSDVAGGTLYIDKSVDGGTTWRQVGSIAAVANSSVTLKVPLSAASYRTRFINGTTAQTAFLLTSALSLN